MSRKRSRSASPENVPDVSISSPIEDKKSIFIGVYSSTLNHRALQALPEYIGASHRVVAWRVPSKQRTLGEKVIYETGHDDDGERHAGKVLEKVLSSAKAEGSLLMARWYGGVMLGPVRFDHIQNCTLEALRRHRQAVSAVAKRAKVVADDAREKEDLLRDLPERDKNIVVLRGLLAVKKGQTASQEQATSSSSPSSKIISYDHLSLDALRRLDRARDATVAWILKQIESAEANAASEDQSNQ